MSLSCKTARCITPVFFLTDRIRFESTSSYNTPVLSPRRAVTRNNGFAWAHFYTTAGPGTLDNPVRFFAHRLCRGRPRRKEALSLTSRSEFRILRRKFDWKMGMAARRCLHHEGPAGAIAILLRLNGFWNLAPAPVGPKRGRKRCLFARFAIFS